MYPQTMNPYSQYPFQMNNYATQNIQTLTRVTGIEGARAYQMNPNSVVALFDNNEDIMYIKTTDGAGFPTIRSFTFTEIIDNKPKLDSNNYVSKEEFEAFKKEVSEYVEQFIWKPNNANTNTSRDNSASKTSNVKHE